MFCFYQGWQAWNASGLCCVPEMAGTWHSEADGKLWFAGNELSALAGTGNHGVELRR